MCTVLCSKIELFRNIFWSSVSLGPSCESRVCPVCLDTIGNKGSGRHQRLCGATRMGGGPSKKKEQDQVSTTTSNGPNPSQATPPAQTACTATSGPARQPPKNSLAKTLSMSASITDDLKQELEQSGGFDKDTVRDFLTKRGIVMETEELDDLFAACDINGDGSLDVSELEQALQLQSPTGTPESFVENMLMSAGVMQVYLLEQTVVVASFILLLFASIVLYSRS